MHDDRLAFNRRAVRPIVCLREGWELIKEDYWLFLGIAVVSQLIAGFVPLAIMLGPMMCGLHICLFRQQRGRTPKFENLFDGFHYFAQSLIATMIVVIPLVFVFIGVYVVFIVGMVAMLQGGNQPGPGMLVIGGVFYLTIIAASIIVRTLTFFMYPLIVDRELSGMEAVTLSIKAALGNLGGVLGVVLLEVLLSLIGVMFCLIGAFFVIPVCFAMVSIAYRHVFPSEDRLAKFRSEPEPWDDDDSDAPADTGIQTEPKPRRRSDVRVQEE